MQTMMMKLMRAMLRGSAEWDRFPRPEAILAASGHYVSQRELASNCLDLRAEESGRV